MRTLLILTCLLFAGVAHAQSPTATPSDAEPTDDEVELLIDQEIADQDLEADLEAEVLPDDGFEFVLENALFQIRRAFTFQAERKVALDQERLHRLDRKLAACTEIGDEKCIDRIETMTQAAQERTQRFLDKKAEVLGNVEENFEAWRDRRQARLDELKENADESEAESLEEFQSKREEAMERRDARLEELRNTRSELRESILEKRLEKFNQIDARLQNREELIEARSPVIKERLDTARDQVQQRAQDLEAQLAD